MTYLRTKSLFLSKNIFVIFFFSILIGCSQQEQYYNEGLKAYNNGKYDLALRKFILSAELGDRDAKNFLGVMYLDGKGTKRNLVEAVRWYREAADQGDRYAQHNLAGVYYYGKGIPKDLRRAAFWYKKSALQGSPSSLNMLGTMYFSGQGVKRNIETAYDYWKKAINAYKKEKPKKYKSVIAIIKNHKINQKICNTSTYSWICNK